MASLSSSNEDETPSMSVQESHRLSIQSLLHACQCCHDNCPLPACHKMKRVVQHARGCKSKINGSCPVCKQVIALCGYHAKQCQEDTCPVPFCLTIKQQIQIQRQQAQLGHPMAVLQQPLPSPTPGIAMQRASTSQTPQPGMYPQPLPSPTPGITMQQASTSQTPQPSMYPQPLPSPTPGIAMQQASTSQTPQPGMYPKPLPSPTPGIPMQQASTSQTPQPGMYPQPLPSPTPGIPMQQPSTSQTPQPGMYPQPLPSPGTPGIPMQQLSTPQPSLRGMASPSFPNVAGRIQPQGKSTSLLPVVPPAQPPPAIFAAPHQIELEEEQMYWVRIEDQISMGPGMVGPVNPLLQMSVNVPHPGSITPPIMRGMQPAQWSTATMPQQSSLQQNIQCPVIEVTAGPQGVVEPQLQGVSQQQACNVSPNALQDLLQTLKAPSSPQQQQQVLNILKSNPQLMAAFIKQRAAKYVANLSGMQPQQAPQQPPQQPGMYSHPVPSPAPATPGIFMQQSSTPQFLEPAPQLSPGGMASLGSPNEGETQSINPQESRRLSIQRCIQSLVHACQCRNCSLPSCQKIKRVMQHLNGCQHKPVCSVCRNLIALCCYHAKQCQENTCPVLFCLNIKHKLRQQQLQHRLQQAQLMRRRMAAMNTRTQGRTKG